MCFSDGVRGLDSFLGELYVDTVVVDLLSRKSQRSVFFVSSLHASVGVVPLSVDTLPCWVNGVGVNEDRVIEACVQIIF